MPYKDSREKTEYVVEGTTARLAYLKDSEERYTYRNSRGQKVSVSRSRADRAMAARRVNEDYYDYAPQREPDEYEEERVKARPKSQPARQPLKRVSFPTLMVLCFLLGAFGYACYSYLSVQSEIEALKSEIASVEQSIATIKNENEERLMQAETNVDLNKVYKIATEELGMVHPKEGQIIKYKSGQSNTVKQYGDIPDEKKSVLEKILDN